MGTDVTDQAEAVIPPSDTNQNGDTVINLSSTTAEPLAEQDYETSIAPPNPTIDDSPPSSSSNSPTSLQEPTGVPSDNNLNTLGADGEIDWKKRGNDLFTKGNYRKAIELYTYGIDYDPSNAALFSNRSAAYLKAEDYERAQRDAEMCIGINSKWPKGYWRKGLSLIEQQRYEEAVACYDEGLKNCNNNESLLVGKRRAQKYLQVYRAHNGALPTDDDALHDNSRGGATAFMTAIDSQNKFGPDAESGRDSKREKRQKAAAQNGARAAQNDVKSQQSHKFPGTQDEEIERISHAPNYYAVLHVSPEATTAEMKKNYHTLARMLHPDKCQIEGADNAMKEVVQAYGTLTNPIKKTLYDQYMKERRDSQAGGEEQTYAEWEARQQPVNMPKWLRVLLGIKGCGWVITGLLFVFMIPILLILVIVIAIVWLICLPYRTVLRCCFPEKYEQMLAEHEREREKMEEEAQDRMHAHL